MGRQARDEEEAVGRKTLVIAQANLERGDD
jgi:hypothetical protein